MILVEERERMVNSLLITTRENRTKGHFFCWAKEDMIKGEMVEGIWQF